MEKQSEALRLADLIEWDNTHDLRVSAAAALRRLHAINAQLLEALKTLRDNSSLSSHQLAIILPAIAAASDETAR